MRPRSLPYETRLHIWHRRQQKRERLFAELGNRCMDCGWLADTPDKLSALHFHHRDPGTKEAGISRMLDYGYEKIIAEAKKCDLICSNCHSVYHAAERRAELFAEGHPAAEMPTS